VDGLTEKLPLWDSYPIFFTILNLPFRFQTPLERRLCSRLNGGSSAVLIEEMTNSLGISSLPYFHYVGGLPPFVSKFDHKNCPNCGGNMMLLSAIGNYNGACLGFFDNDYVQMIFTICELCCCISGTHLVD
jgi:hypothetical protein